MSEVHKRPTARGGWLGSASLWLGLFALALALPPTLIFFLVPGFWVAGLNVTSMLSPLLAIAALGTGAGARRGPKSGQAKAGMWLGLITLISLAALAVRIRALLAPGA